MEIDSRRISRLIRQSRTRERRLDQLIQNNSDFIREYDSDS